MEGFDWVAALGSCTLSVIFEQLKLDVESDVGKRNTALKTNNKNYSFRVVANTDGFCVSRADGTDRRRVAQFTIKNSTIEVLDESGRKVTSATLTLDDNGDCRFLVDGKEKVSWQLRKLALEKLFLRTRGETELNPSLPSLLASAFLLS